MKIATVWMRMRQAFLCVLGVFLLLSCNSSPRFAYFDQYPEIFPDFIEVTVPESMTKEEGSLFTFQMMNGYEKRVERERRGDTLWISVYAWPKGGKEGIRYRPFPIYVSHDEIDPYVAYRLIEPGYESWTNISISQRELATFAETSIVTNQMNDQGCINCHCFLNGNPDRMLFHSRGKLGGTIFYQNGRIHRVDFLSIAPSKQATYPAWHPGGRYVAFSSNHTQQSFMMHGHQPIEVYDIESDIILYDTEKGTVLADSLLNTPQTWETFPAWSPSGDKLYYCAADSVSNPSANRHKVHYHLMSITFDSQRGSFIGTPEEVSLQGIDLTKHSVSFPVLSGHYLMFTLTDFGTFPIWHDEADLWLLDLSTGETRPLEELNSHSAESYHSFSSNGRWVVFGSRRLDGRYTRLFFSHFDEMGHFSKPFLLPQSDPEENILRLKSYNRPEFVRGKVREITQID